MDPFWHRVARVALPNGYTLWDPRGPREEGTVVIEIAKAFVKDTHWFHCFKETANGWTR